MVNSKHPEMNWFLSGLVTVHVSHGQQRIANGAVALKPQVLMVNHRHRIHCKLVGQNISADPFHDLCTVRVCSHT